MTIKSVRGMNDILQEEARLWARAEGKAREILAIHGYEEIRTPVAERTELFARGIGETTDIVSKEMYTFDDRRGQSLTLRPEGTAPVVRAYIKSKIYASNPLTKLYYIGPMFRYERPQSGRSRQFHQIGVEVLGSDDPLVDSEVIEVLMRLLEGLGGTGLVLEINSLGCPGCRPDFVEAIRDFAGGHVDDLCEECGKRVERNPLRLLDCKVEKCRAILEGAPEITNHLCERCALDFTKVRSYLDRIGLDYIQNPRIVRGLDYYTRTAFEVTSSTLGAQNAVAGGGRYDGLVEELGGPSVPGVGFAVGLERLLMGFPEAGATEEIVPTVFVAPLGEEARTEGCGIVSNLRDRGIRSEIGVGGKSLRSMMRRAGSIGARLVVILGEDEMGTKAATVRDMDEGSQTEIDLSILVDSIEKRIRNGGS
ncbi:histidine--tRNA ligase [Thermodesulfobacteriota bacterium]